MRLKIELNSLLEQFAIWFTFQNNEGNSYPLSLLHNLFTVACMGSHTLPGTK